MRGKYSSVLWCVQDRRADDDAVVETRLHRYNFAHPHPAVTSAASEAVPRTCVCWPGMCFVIKSWLAESSPALTSDLTQNC